MGPRGKPFSPEYLADDFGSDADVAREGVHALYDAITDTEDAKAEVFFRQWKILFGEVCGYDVEHPSENVKKLARFYGLTWLHRVFNGWRQKHERIGALSS